MNHGTRSTYTNHSCRCGPCRAAHSKAIREIRTRRAAWLAVDPTAATHGRSSTYVNWGCRCAPCRAAKKLEQARRRAQR